MYDKKILKDNLPKRMRYYQGMIDLNILEKGENYKNLKKSFVIFICTFDLFGLGRHVYTFENRCIEDLELPLGDDTTKIILNTKGTLDDVSPEMKKLLNYIDGEAPSDEFTEELEMGSKIVSCETFLLRSKKGVLYDFKCRLCPAHAADQSALRRRGI